MNIKLLLLSFITFISINLLGQTSNVTATITDPDGQTWNNGTYTINFIPTPGIPGPYTWNGGQPFTQQFKGAMNGGGVITQSLPSSNFITPAGSLWQFTLCSNTSAPCQNVTLGVSGASPNLSTALSGPLVAARFQAGQYSFGYLDAEVTGPNGGALIPGITYWNVTNQVTRQWNGLAWQNLSGGGGGTPAGPNGSVQYDNAGSFGAINSVAAGSAYVSNGTLAPPITQVKPMLDARDQGIDCTFTNDSSAALNALTNNTGTFNGIWLMFPPNCHIKLASTWTIKNASSFKIGGFAGGGANGAPATAPTITWTGSSGGTMIDMEYVDGFTIQYLVVDGGGSAGTGINIDKTGTCVGCVNTTDGLLQRITVNAGSSGGANANWIGVAMSQVSVQNVEDMRVEDSAFYCNSATSGEGIDIGASQNAKNEIAKHVNFHNCFYAVHQKNGSLHVVDSEFSQNGGTCGSGTGADIRVDAATDIDIFSGNLDEGGTQFLNCDNDAPAGGCNTSFAIIIQGNHFAPAGCENTANYWINASPATNPIIVVDNGWDSDNNLLKLIGTGNSSINRPIFTRGNIFPNQIFNPWWTQGASQASPGASDTEDYGLFIGNRLLAASMTGQKLSSPFMTWRSYLTSSSFDDYAIQNIINSDASTLLIKHFQGGAGSFINLDAKLPSLLVGATGNPVTPTISNQGTPGGTSYTYAVVGYVGSTACVGGTNTSGSPTISTATGNATLSTSNFNRINFQGIAGSSEYGIWRTASGGTPSSVGLIGCISAIQMFNANYALGPAYKANQVISNFQYQFDDTGLAGNSAALPNTNTTGASVFNGTVTTNSTVTANAAVTVNATLTANSLTTPGVNGGISAVEGTGASVPPAANTDVLWADSAAHRWKMNNNNGVSQTVLGFNDWAAPGTIGSTTPNTGAFTTLTGTTITSLGGPVSGTWNCVNVAPVNVTANTTNDQNLMACTVPAGALNSVGRTLRIHTKSLYTTPIGSTATLTFKVKLCSVSGCGSGNVATLVNITSTANPGTITNNGVLFDVESTTQTGGAASRHEASGDLMIDLGASPTSAATTFADTNTTTIAGSPSDIDLTAQNFLQITVAFSVGSGSNSVTERQLVADTVN